MRTPASLALTLFGVGLLAVAGLVREPNGPSTVRAPASDLSSRPVTAPYVPPRGYVCYRASGPIPIDGRLDKEVWKAVPWTEDFVDIEGERKPKPRYRTRVKMLWDDECLYIAAELEPQLQATHTRHDSYIFHDDNDFEVFLYPDGDSHLYAELEMNALNTTWDLLLTMPYKDGGHAIDAWEIAGLRTAVHLDGTLNDPENPSRGWTIEIAWPWQGLKQLSKNPVPPRDGDQWRINFSRVEWDFEIVEGKYRKIPKRPEHNWVWSPQGVIDMHRPERWGYLQFSTAPPGTVAYQPDPAAPARHLLHQVYYAQRQYREQHGTWASELGQLGLGNLRDPSLIGPVRLEMAGSLFEVSAQVRRPGATPQRWHVRQDARVWVD